MNAKQRKQRQHQSDECGLKSTAPVVEHLSQNSSRFNQVAKAALRKLKADVSPAYLYSLQLAIYGLRAMKTEGWMQDYQPEAIDQAELMLGWSPEFVESWIRYGEENRREDSEADEQSALWLQEHKDPIEAAEQLGMNLWENLQEKVPDLSPPPSRRREQAV